MRLLKPAWVAHDGKPIFSIDIHPDSSRFATGGQGDNSGKVAIWNMAPVRDETAEMNEQIPKLLCQMDNHLACVNCVRWSNNGKYLASAGDDKLIMIWQTSRYSGVSTVFGSAGKLVNHEQWRVGSTLKGHSGDVLDVAWSPHDAWLASCSVDNTIVIWNAEKFPEQISVLRGHSGLVKGVTWDPVGKYLASQSDDKSLKVWRTRDWQQEAEVTDPFQECGGTTHVLRLSWSPDGHHIVSAHAMNNSGPTAQIVEREGWKTSMDFVGHRRAITVVRFNPNILSKKIKKHHEKAQTFTCCAIGSRDRSLSIWLTALKRPLVVTHDLFTNSVVDVSWTQCGMELLCCSVDGTVAYLGFSEDELGTPLPTDDRIKLQEKTYGKSLLSKTNAASNQIIESAAMLNIKQQRAEATKEVQETKSEGIAGSKAPAPPSTPTVNGSTPSRQLGMTKQIETRTKEGKRRITPIFLSPGPESLSRAPKPFVVSTEPTFSSSKEQSSIGVEKRAGAPSAAWLRESSLNSSLLETPPRKSGSEEGKAGATSSEEKASPLHAMASMDPKSAERAKAEALSDRVGERSSEGVKEVERSGPDLSLRPPLLKHKLPPGSALDGGQKKKDRRGRPRKDRTLELQRTQAAAEAAAQAAVTAVASAAPAVKERTVYSTAGLDLPVPRIDKSVSIQIAGAVGSDTALVLEVENHLSTGGSGNLHQLRCLKGGNPVWDAALSSPAVACAGNSHLSCVACADKSLSVYATATGRRLHPAMALDSAVSSLRCSAHFLMTITSRGSLFVWDVNTMAAKIKNESLTSLVADSETRIESCLLTEQGLPVLTLSTGRSYTYTVELGCWVVLSDRADTLHLCADHQSCTPAHTVSKTTGPLATLQANQHRVGSQASRLYRSNSALQRSATLSHLEGQVSCCLTLRSAREYHFWLQAYVRYLVQEGLESKLRDLCDDFLGPMHKSKSTSHWQSTVLSFDKRTLLRELLPLFAENLSLQRLFVEYKDQLDSVQ